MYSTRRNIEYGAHLIDEFSPDFRNHRANPTKPIDSSWGLLPRAEHILLDGPAWYTFSCSALKYGRTLSNSKDLVLLMLTMISDAFAKVKIRFHGIVAYPNNSCIKAAHLHLGIGRCIFDGTPYRRNERYNCEPTSNNGSFLFFSPHWI